MTEESGDLRNVECVGTYYFKTFVGEAPRLTPPLKMPQLEHSETHLENWVVEDLQ